MTLHHRLYTRRLQAWLSLQEAFPAHSQAPQGCFRGTPAALQGRWASSSMCSSPQPGISRAAAPPRGSPTHCRWLPGAAPHSSQIGHAPRPRSQPSDELCLCLRTASPLQTRHFGGMRLGVRALVPAVPRL